MPRIVLVFAVALLSCGPSAAASAAFEQSRSDALLTVQAYQRDAAAANDGSACLLAHQRYDEAARQQLAVMTPLSQSMGVCSPMHGGASFGMRRMCGDLVTELDRHATAACSGDVTSSRAEAESHCQRMLAWLTPVERLRALKRRSRSEGLLPTSAPAVWKEVTVHIRGG